MRARLAASLVAAWLVAACSGGLGIPAPPAATPGAGASSPAASPLPAGTYTSAAFQPAVTFTVPAGWEKASDASVYLQLRPVGSEVLGIHLFRDPVAASQDAACPRAPEPGVGATSTELVAWIRARPGLVVGNPVLTTVGGLRGVSIDVGLKPSWTQSCPFANGNPTVPLIVGKGDSYQWIVVGNERLRLYVLDAPGGGTLIVDVDAFDGSQMDTLLAAAAPIVRSMRFAGAPG